MAQTGTVRAMAIEVRDDHGPVILGLTFDVLRLRQRQQELMEQ